METKTAIFALTSALLVAIGSRPALANENFFTPITGVQFFSTTNSPNVVYSDSAEVYSTDTGAMQKVEASLGAAQGGSNAFTLYGVPGPMGSVPSCSVRVKFEGSSTYAVFSGATSYANGFFSQFFQTNVPARSTFYYVICNLPSSPQTGQRAKIFGVKPHN